MVTDLWWHQSNQPKLIQQEDLFCSTEATDAQCCGYATGIVCTPMGWAELYSTGLYLFNG